eukprot:TRINITY_DN12929_c0_g1_i1.p1 TRINITY_DN12929_c0_g1~~TRINITY_DN12929_c0_g1_i1.p1  ORF type:complete len:219 (-),score=63.64 TRINITY_DN12929_c0_g1_i1:210-866(-)
MDITIEVGVSLEESGLSDKLEEVNSTLQNYLEMETELSAHIAALTKLKDLQLQKQHQTHNPEEENLLETFERFLATEKKERKQREAQEKKQHPKLKEFRQKIWRVHHKDTPLPEEENEELVIMATNDEADILCPLTRKELEEPMKNQTCGHVYSKEAIYSYIKSKKAGPFGQVQCPVAGCRQAVTLGTLEYDKDAERRVKKTQRKHKDEEDPDDIIEV